MSIPGTLLSLSAMLSLVLASGCAGDPTAQDPDLDEAQGGSDPPPPQTAPGDPLPGLTEEQLALFELGVEDFAEVEEVDEGLGQVMNEAGCGVCHDQAATGGASTLNLTEVRFGFTDADGNFDPLLELGGPLQQLQGIGAVEIAGCEDVFFEQETIPIEANATSGRLTQPLFGLGLVDGIPDESLRQLAARQAERSPDTAGRVSEVINIATGEPDVGKFGWKAAVATLFDFSGDAYLNEMGITNPLFPDESCFNGDCETTLRCDPVADPEDDGEALVNFTNFMTLLAPTPTLRRDREADQGASIFRRIDCDDCHTPRHTTGPNPDVAALDQVEFSPFSDFLLHDMGSLNDGIGQGGTAPNEMRTQPLWGARFRTAFLHDGRAATVADAIRAHDGQGRRAARAFDRLRRSERRALLAFIDTL